MTGRQALGALKAEWLLIAEHGRGVFVRTTPMVRRAASDRFARKHREAGEAAFIAEAQGIGAPSVDELEVGHENATLELRDALGLPARSKVLARRRRYLIDGHPVEMAESYVPSSIAKGTQIEERHTGPGGTYARDWVQGADGRRKQSDEQARHEATGMPLWEVEVLYKQSLSTGSTRPREPYA